MHWIVIHLTPPVIPFQLPVGCGQFHSNSNLWNIQFWVFNILELQMVQYMNEAFFCVTSFKMNQFNWFTKLNDWFMNQDWVLDPVSAVDWRGKLSLMTFFWTSHIQCLYTSRTFLVWGFGSSFFIIREVWIMGNGRINNILCKLFAFLIALKSITLGLS